MNVPQITMATSTPCVKYGSVNGLVIGYSSLKGIVETRRYSSKVLFSKAIFGLLVTYLKLSPSPDWIAAFGMRHSHQAMSIL